MKNKAAVFPMQLVFLTIQLATMLEIYSGTVVVVGYSRQRVVIAADSKTVYEISQRAEYNRCKIIQLDNKLIFVPVGKTGDSYERNGVEVSWSTTEVARAILSSGDAPQNHLPLWIANAWAAKVKERIIWALSNVRQYSARLRKSGNPFSQGYFFGFEPDGSISVVGAALLFEPHTEGKVRAHVASLPLGQSMVFSGAGETKTIDELRNSKTPFAREEARSWSSRARELPSSDRDISKAIRWVEITIAKDQSGSTGGTIDAVELLRGGKMRWFRNPNCGSK